MLGSYIPISYVSEDHTEARTSTPTPPPDPSTNKDPCFRCQQRLSKESELLILPGCKEELPPTFLARVVGERPS